MLVWSRFEPATSRRAVRCSTSWANRSAVISSSADKLRWVPWFLRLSVYTNWTWSCSRHVHFRVFQSLSQMGVLNLNTLMNSRIFWRTQAERLSEDPVREDWFCSFSSFTSFTKYIKLTTGSMIIQFVDAVVEFEVMEALMRLPCLKYAPACFPSG